MHGLGQQLFLLSIFGVYVFTIYKYYFIKHDTKDEINLKKRFISHSFSSNVTFSKKSC